MPPFKASESFDSDTSVRRFGLVIDWRAVCQIAIGTLLILLAVAANRAPSVFTDSDDYYLLGRQIVTDAAALVTPAAPPHVLSAEEQDAAAEVADDLHMGHTQMASRSAAYAMLLYPLEALGSLWLVAAAQALATAWLIWLVWRIAVPNAPAAWYLLGMAGLSAGTTLPFFAGFAMPDIFAAAAILGTALLLIYWRQTGPRWVVGALLTFALTVHTSHLLLAVMLLVATPLVLWWLRGAAGAARIPGLAVIGAICVAWMFNAGYGAIVQARTGEALRHQPFLAARLLADGPGRDYLRHACALGHDYALCRFKHQPLDDSEDILWSDLPATGVFLRSDYDMRIRLEDEETRFVIGTLAYDPVGVVAAALRNWGRQLVAFQVEEPVRNPRYYLTDDYWGDTSLPLMIKRVAECGPRGDNCPLRMTPQVSQVWHGAVVLFAAAAIGWAMWRRRGIPFDDEARRLYALAGLIVGGVIVNAAICGILSGPFARYEARVIWLIPFAALLLVSAEWRRLTRSAAP